MNVNFSHLNHCRRLGCCTDRYNQQSCLRLPQTFLHEFVTNSTSGGSEGRSCSGEDQSSPYFFFYFFSYLRKTDFHDQGGKEAAAHEGLFTAVL